MRDEELREKLQRVDPAVPGNQVKPVTAVSSQETLERIMATSESRSPAMRYLLGAAAVLVLVVGGFAVFGNSVTPPMQLGLGNPDPMASCAIPDAAILADVPTALKGTVTAVDGDRAKLDVDEWYVGGEAESVELLAPSGLEALLGSIDFTEGSTYLIAAYDGTVTFCGLSGEATPDLQALYDEAFAG